MFGGAARYAFAKQGVYHHRFNLVVELCGGAVQVDIAHLIRRKLRISQRLVNGANCAFALWMRAEI